MRRTSVILFFLVAWGTQAQPVLRVYTDVGSTGPYSILNWSPPTSWAKVYRITTYPNWDAGTVVSPTQYSRFGEYLTQNTVTIYRVQPTDSNGNPVGSPSNSAIVSTYSYSNDPLTTTTKVKAQHITELRTVVDAIRAKAGLSANSWTPASVTTSTHFNPAHVNDLRTALTAALQQLQLTPPPFVDGTLTSTSPVRLSHIQQLRIVATAFPTFIYVGSVSVSERYFSPNHDGVKDTTTIGASVAYSGIYASTPVRATMSIVNAASATILTRPLTNDALSFTWDGSGPSGLQPDGDYTIRVTQDDDPTTQLAYNLATIDNTPPALAITSPASNYLISNIRLNGSGNVQVQGTATDAHLSGWTLGFPGSDPPFATGTTAAVSGTWNSLPHGNGPYTFRLNATDLAGNTAQLDLPVAVRHFSASQDIFQLNPTTGDTITYTSIVPYPVNLAVSVRPYGSTTPIRTLFNGPVQTGTDTRVWDGKDDLGVTVGDSRYQYVVDVTDGQYTLHWDTSAKLMNGGDATQYPYTRCVAPDGSLLRCDSTALPPFDPYINQPLRITYCVGGGEPTSATACSGQTNSLPAFVVIKATSLTETDLNCNFGVDAIFCGFLPAGAHQFPWYGRNVVGQDFSGAPYLTVIRRHDNWPSNVTLVFGQSPQITDVAITPLMINPAWSSGQDIVVSIARPTTRPAYLTASFRNLQSYSTLRTVTTPSSTAAQQTVHWDGRADNGELVAPGLYQVTIRVTDSSGAIGSVAWSPIVTVRY